MTCQELSDAYELYALGALDGPEKEAIDEHVARSCETCMKEINGAVENNAIIFSAVPKLDPPPRLRSRILAGFGLETRPFWVRALPWSVAAASLAVLLLTVVSSARRSELLLLTTWQARSISSPRPARDK